MSQDSNTKEPEDLNGDESRTVQFTVNSEMANQVLELFQVPMPDASEIDQINIFIRD